LAASERYGRGTRAFHWITAALVVVILPLGLLHDAVKPLNVMPWHKGLGLALLLIVPLRLLWRLTVHTVVFPETSPILRRSAAAMHASLYVLLLAMPLSGWIIASSGSYPLHLLGLVNWPKLAVAKGDPLVSLAREVHELGGWLLLVLLTGHIAAALWHHVHLRDGVLRRML